MTRRAGDVSPHTSDEESTEQDANFQWYVVAMRHALDRLRYMPATFRDQVIQVAQLQRYWLLANAYLEYQSRLRSASSDTSTAADVAHGLMGAWSTDPKVVQHLMALGIPVWFCRDHHVVHGEVRRRSRVQIVDAQHINSVPFFGEEPLYRGLPGEAHLEATMRGSTVICLTPQLSLCSSLRIIATVERSRKLPNSRCRLTNLLPPHNPRAYVPSSHAKLQHLASSHVCSYRHGLRLELHSTNHCSADPKKKPGKPHPSQIRGRDKFAEFPHRWMPAAIPSWERAMQSVDRRGKARDSEDLWGYWIPEPALLVSPTDPAKVERHVFNWLRARTGWLYLLWVPGCGATKIGTQAWRKFLNGVPEESTAESSGKFEIREILGGVFADAYPIDWHERSVAQLSDGSQDFVGGVRAGLPVRTPCHRSVPKAKTHRPF